MDNVEWQHPKSCYFTYQSDKGLFKAGPVWDFDWGIRLSQTSSLRDFIYYNALFKSPMFMAAVRRVWDTFARTANGRASKNMDIRNFIIIDGVKIYHLSPFVTPDKTYLFVKIWPFGANCAEGHTHFCESSD